VTSTDRPSRSQSRGRILALLRDAGRPLEISELIAGSGLSAGAVRFHLANLTRAGSVCSVRSSNHSHPGRPRVAYEASHVDAADPAEAYRKLAALLGRELLRSGSSIAAFEAGRHEAATSGLPGIESHWSAAEVIAARLRADGFEPTVSRDGHTVELNHCPFHGLAAELPGVVCAVHEGMTAAALESAGLPAHVRVVPVLDGSGPCLVHLLSPEVPDANDSPASKKESVS
jgi:predicted ArsR family transcriptional regulator